MFEEEKKTDSDYDYGYDYDLLCFKVDTLNHKISGTKNFPIAYIFDDNFIAKDKRLKLLNDMIDSLSVELGLLIAQGKLPELKDIIN